MWPFTLPGFLLLSGAALILAGLVGAYSRLKIERGPKGSLPQWFARIMLVWGVIHLTIGLVLSLNATDNTPPAASPTPMPSQTATAIARSSALPTVVIDPTSTDPAPPTPRPSETPPPASTPTQQTPATSPPPQPSATQAPARSIQFIQDGPQLSPDTSCTRISWVVEGYLRVHVFLDGTPEGEVREATGGQDLCPGKDKAEETHILRAYYTETDFDERRVVVPIQ